MKKEKLDQYIEYGIGGVPELKKEEKEHFLGEFKERIVLAIQKEQLVERKKCFNILENKIQEQWVDKIIVNANLNHEDRVQCMKLAKRYNKHFKLANRKTPIAIVLASNEAQDIQDIYLNGHL